MCALYLFLGVLRSEPGTSNATQHVEVTQRCYDMLESSTFSGLCNNLFGRNIVIIEASLPLPTGRLVCVRGYTDSKRLKYDGKVDVQLERELQSLSQSEIMMRTSSQIQRNPWRLLKVRELHVALGLKEDFTVEDLYAYINGNVTANANVPLAILNLLRRRYISEM